MEERYSNISKKLNSIIEWIDWQDEESAKFFKNSVEIGDFLTSLTEKASEIVSRKCEIYANGVFQGSLLGENNNHAQISMFVQNLYATGTFQLPVKIHIRISNGQEFYYTLNNYGKFSEFLQFGFEQSSDAMEQNVVFYDIKTSVRTEEEKELDEMKAITRRMLGAGSNDYKIECIDNERFYIPPIPSEKICLENVIIKFCEINNIEYNPEMFKEFIEITKSKKGKIAQSCLPVWNRLFEKTCSFNIVPIWKDI